MTLSDMYCTQCGKKNIPVPRKKSKERECGHLKKMYCIYCNKMTNMVEIRGFDCGYTLEDFNLEYTLHNFNKDGTRKLSWNEFKKHLNNGGDVLE
jgi:hypothetical protein